MRFSIPSFRRGALALLLAACTLLSAVSAHAYVLEGQRWPNNQSINVNLGLGTAGRVLSDGATDWNQVAADALSQWNQFLGSGVQFVALPSPTPLNGTQGDNVNTVFFSPTAFGKAFGSDTLAITTYYYSRSTLIETDVVFNSAKNFDSYRGRGRFDAQGRSIPDLRRVALHEFGHALGLDHPDLSGQQVAAIMNSRISDLEVLQPDDIAGLQAIYGVRDPAPVPAAPGFFDGEVTLSGGVCYLQFAGNGNVFGFYSHLSEPGFIYHFDLGYAYVVDAADGKAGVYLYDFASGGWFYTSPSFPFPYLYDFSLDALVYYYPTNGNPQRYTKGPRYFYNFRTGQVFTK